MMLPGNESAAPAERPKTSSSLFPGLVFLFFFPLLLQVRGGLRQLPNIGVSSSKIPAAAGNFFP
jgi:hypothetical protein